VNRTGTLILCDLALAMASTKNEVNFSALMNYMREQRAHMVNKMVNLTSRFREYLHQN
jgi:protein tyrosine phosphatase